jgi:hypothetical protein
VARLESLPASADDKALMELSMDLAFLALGALIFGLFGLYAAFLKKV